MAHRISLQSRETRRGYLFGYFHNWDLPSAQSVDTWMWRRHLHRSRSLALPSIWLSQFDPFWIILWVFGVWSDPFSKSSGVCFKFACYSTKMETIRQRNYLVHWLLCEDGLKQLYSTKMEPIETFSLSDIPKPDSSSVEGKVEFGCLHHLIG